MKRNMIVAAAVAMTCSLFAGTAQAGGIVVDLREPSVRYHSVYSLGGDFGLAAASATGGVKAPGGSGGSNDSDSDNGGSQPVKKLANGPFDPYGPVSAYEVSQIQAGLITEDEAAAGCGGATAATGPAGLLPLLVAAGALLRRRR